MQSQSSRKKLQSDAGKPPTTRGSQKSKSPTSPSRFSNSGKDNKRGSHISSTEGLKINVQPVAGEEELSMGDSAEDRAIENTKRQMDKVLLTMDALKQKNLLLDLVDKIIMRQNTENIPLHFDSFQNETSSRKVLRELLGEFHLQAEDLKKRIGKNDEGMRMNKS